MSKTRAKSAAPRCLHGARVARVTGKPDYAHISTSMVERQNLTMRMGTGRFTRLTNAFQRKLKILRRQLPFATCITILIAFTGPCASRQRWKRAFPITSGRWKKWLHWSINGVFWLNMNKTSQVVKRVHVVVLHHQHLQPPNITRPSVADDEFQSTVHDYFCVHFPVGILRAQLDKIGRISMFHSPYPSAECRLLDMGSFPVGR